jgi:hypothetical protein
MTKTITLNQIKKANFCKDNYEHLCKALGGIEKYGEHTPIKISQIVEHNDFYDALWCIENILPDSKKDLALLSADYAERVLHIYEKEYPDDKRVRECIQATRDYADGKITEEKLKEFKKAANANTDPVAAAAAASWASAAAYATVSSDATTAARTAAYVAAYAAYVAAYAAFDASADAAWIDAFEKEREHQIELLIERFG